MKRSHFIVIGLVLAILAGAAAWYLYPSGDAEKLSFEAIMKCQGVDRPACLDGLFRQYLEDHTVGEALARMREYEARDANFKGGGCHPAMHALGRETFRKTGTVHDSFAACDQTCHSGCYHGAMERFLRGGSDGAHITLAELETKAIAACEPDQESRFRFQCLHGLGHAVMYFSEFDLAQSLGICAKLPEAWSARSCSGGVFMENVFTADPARRDLSENDYHYPCTDAKVPLQFREECYVMQTSRMSELGLGTAGLFEECRKAGQYTLACMQSIGRDVSNIARSVGPEAGVEKCELGAPGEEQEACIRGVIYALIDNTWNGRDALPFCAALDDIGNRSYCFKAGRQYLTGFFEKPQEEFAAECAKYVPDSPECDA